MFDKVKNILKFYGLVYFVFLAVIVALGVIYLNKLDYIAVSTDVPLTKKDTAQPEGDLPFVKGEIMPPVDIMKVGVPTPELIEKGKAQFTVLCSGCHGTEGKGDGPAGLVMNPRPRNFHELTGWTNGFQLSKMFKTTQEGTPKGMPSFSYVPPADRIAILHYIRTFRNDYPPAAPSELAEMDKTYSLSAGFKQPSQIPLNLAIEKILNESSVNNNKVYYISRMIENSMKDSNAAIVKELFSDVERGVRTLNTNPKWLESENEFIRIAEANPGANGFRTSLYLLSPQELTNAYNYLKSLFVSYKV